MNGAVDSIRNRRESHTKTKETKPLFTTEALPTERKPRTQHQPKKRTRPPPSTPVLTFDPKQNRIRSGRQEPSPLTGRFSPEASRGGSLEERADLPAYGTPTESPLSSEPIGHDSLSHKRPRVFSNSSVSCQASPNQDMTSASLEYDSPLSYTSSSSPATSDQSATTFPEGSGYEMANFQISPTGEDFYPSHSYSPAVQGDEQYLYGSVGHVNYPIPYPDTNYGRVAPNAVPSYATSYRPPTSR